MLHDDNFCSDTDATATGRRRNRNRGEESCQSFTCIPPWLAFTQWFRGGKSKKGKVGNEVVVVSDPTPNNATGNAKEEEPFNTSVGFFLIYLATATRNEVSKMVQMQRQMDLRLQNFQNEMLSKYCSISSFSNAGVQGEISRHDQKHESTNKSLRMAQMGEELEAEFERIQQIQDEEEQQYSEIAIEESAPEWSLDTTRLEQLHHEEEQQQELSNHCYYCVPPLELERKLHELLESTQESRINELEAALEYAMQKLGDKEREVSWWKDTARLISQRFPGINHELQRQGKMKIGRELNNVIRF